MDDDCKISEMVKSPFHRLNWKLLLYLADREEANGDSSERLVSLPVDDVITQGGSSIIELLSGLAKSEQDKRQRNGKARKKHAIWI